MKFNEEKISEETKKRFSRDFNLLENENCSNQPKFHSLRAISIWEKKFKKISEEIKKDFHEIFDLLEKLTLEKTIFNASPNLLAFPRRVTLLLSESGGGSSTHTPVLSRIL
jgi:hypothetical protein